MPANVVAADQTRSTTCRRSLRSAIASTPQHTAYASAARGYKAGGFNPAALPGSEAYGEEHAWHVEGGVKSTLAGGKVAANAAVFFIDWDDLQLNVPNPFVPGQFYIANVGGARSRGVEFDVTARPRPAIDVFAALGFTSARFGDGTMASGVEVADNDLPYTPDYTATFGGQLSRAITSTISGFGRAEVVADRRVLRTTKPTPKARTPIRSSTSAPARAPSGCSPRCGSATRSTRGMCRSRFRIRVCAVGLHRREWPPAHVRHQRRDNFLGSGIRRSGDQGTGAR